MRRGRFIPFLFMCQHTDSQNVAELFMYFLLLRALVTWLAGTVNWTLGLWQQKRNAMALTKWGRHDVNDGWRLLST